MSVTRIVFLVLLVALMAAYAVYSSPGSYAWMVVTGRCRQVPAPAICTSNGTRHGFAWFTPKHY
jgi:hypothetical protein